MKKLEIFTIFDCFRSSPEFIMCLSIVYRFFFQQHFCVSFFHFLIIFFQQHFCVSCFYRFFIMFFQQHFCVSFFIFSSSIFGFHFFSFFHFFTAAFSGIIFSSFVRATFAEIMFLPFCGSVNVSLYVCMYVCMYVCDGLSKCLFPVLLINRNSMRAASCLPLKNMTYLDDVKTWKFFVTFGNLSKTTGIG